MARYKDAIRWIVENDDTEWINEPDELESVTAALIADLFEKDSATVRADIKRELWQAQP